MKIHCESHYQTQWSFNHGNLPNNAEIRSNSEIYISRFNHNNEGYYECRGLTKNMQKINARSLLKIMGKNTFVFNYIYSEVVLYLF